MSQEAVFASIEEAISKSLKLGRGKRFKQSVEIIVALKDIDLKSPQARIRETVFLPNRPPKEAKVCVVAHGDMELQAREAGVEVLNRQDLQNLSQNKREIKKLARRCYWVLVRADLMGLAGRILGPALGPRGKAPVPVPPNANIKDLIERYKAAVWVRIRNQPQVMAKIGTEDMSPKELAENALAVIQVIENRLGRGKIARVYVKKTMGPPVEVPALG
ncbi:50S ribosomal protein L1 [Aeropyrum camini]|uniref:Large ribosomal subunit protein uL1 n=1 Tax=Aeropyrum camini SY1 = JCM 12091 TaxID=1198449 RepID=U3TBB1_9CREN|nr:50S ribosomal protein L1 [Aeropyrum camini]BAN90832.1 50S ribosomal protein L1 [Aeropyrum camini SY1 = JCM 12091]